MTGRDHREFAVQFAIGETESNKINVGGYAGFSLFIPDTMATFTTVSYLGRVPGKTAEEFAIVSKDGAQIVDTVAPGQWNILQHDLFSSLREIKLVAPVGQTGFVYLLGLE